MHQLAGYLPITLNFLVGRGRGFIHPSVKPSPGRIQKKTKTSNPEKRWGCAGYRAAKVTEPRDTPRHSVAGSISLQNDPPQGVEGRGVVSELAIAICDRNVK